MKQAEEPILCDVCGAPMRLAPGIDYFCETKGCELGKLKTLFAQQAAESDEFERGVKSILERLDADGGDFAKETAEALRRLLPMLHGAPFT